MVTQLGDCYSRTCISRSLGSVAVTVEPVLQGALSLVAVTVNLYLRVALLNGCYSRTDISRSLSWVIVTVELVFHGHTVRRQSF